MHDTIFCLGTVSRSVIVGTDIDECLEALHDCSQHAVCINVDGSYTCECVFGYEGNGVNCTRTFVMHVLSLIILVTIMHSACMTLLNFVCFGTVSRSVIIGTGVAGSLLVGAILLLLTIAGCSKIIQKIQSRIPKKKQRV